MNQEIFMLLKIAWQLVTVHVGRVSIITFLYFANQMISTFAVLLLFYLKVEETFGSCDCVCHFHFVREQNFT
jgi:hypothetical protein